MQRGLPHRLRTHATRWWIARRFGVAISPSIPTSPTTTGPPLTRQRQPPICDKRSALHLPEAASNRHPERRLAGETALQTGLPVFRSVPPAKVAVATGHRYCRRTSNAIRTAPHSSRSSVTGLTSTFRATSTPSSRSRKSTSRPCRTKSATSTGNSLRRGPK